MSESELPDAVMQWNDRRTPLGLIAVGAAWLSADAHTSGLFDLSWVMFFIQFVAIAAILWITWRRGDE